MTKKAIKSLRNASEIAKLAPSSLKKLTEDQAQYLEVSKYNEEFNKGAEIQIKISDLVKHIKAMNQRRNGPLNGHLTLTVKMSVRQQPEINETWDVWLDDKLVDIQRY